MTSGKILTLDELAVRAQQLKGQGKKVVLCHGTFDLMHAGHIRHMQRAKEEYTRISKEGNPVGTKI